MLADRVIEETEARQLPALIDEWSRADDERRWIARALRIDLALLTDHPGLVIPSLHRRCVVESADFHAPVAEPTPVAVRALVAAWTDAWSAGRPWLRAVRPPSVPLTAGVIEEYRTSVRGELWASPDGRELGVIGPDRAIAWHRASGRRVAPPGLDRRPPRWQLAARSPGTLRLTRGGATRRIEVAPDDVPYGVVEVDPRHVVVDLRQPLPDDDDDELHALIETDTGTVLWRRSGSVLAAATTPDGLLTADRHALTLRDPATGAPLAAWRGLPADDLRCLADGAWVTRVQDVIRVWERAALPAAFPAALVRSGEVQLSPDGSRALTDRLLCDGRSGARIATIPITGHGAWLENGPPANAWLLRDRVLAQCLPFGLQLWDTTDGQSVLDDRERGADAIDSVAIDPDGRFLAIARCRRRTVTLMTLHGGPALRVHATELGPRPRLGFSRDGAQLWWIAANGERAAMSTAAPYAVRALRADEPLPEQPATPRPAVHDGLVTVDGLLGIVDDRELIQSAAGDVVLGFATHLVRTHGLEINAREK